MSAALSLKHEVAEALLVALSMFLLALSFCSGDVGGGSVFVHLSSHLSAMDFVSWHILVEGVVLASQGTAQVNGGQMCYAEIEPNAWREGERGREGKHMLCLFSTQQLSITSQGEITKCDCSLDFLSGSPTLKLPQ